MSSACRPESQYPKSLSSQYFIVLIGVGNHPGEEVAGAQRRLLFVGYIFEYRRRADDITEPRIALDFELRVGRHRAAVTGLVEECRWIIRDFERSAAAIPDPFEFRRRHRPRL